MSLDDMGTRPVPGCLECGRTVTRGVLFASDDVPGTFAWRYTHQANRCKPKFDKDSIWTALPHTLEAWVLLEMRLIDQFGPEFLWGRTNWRFVMEAVIRDRVIELNSWEPE